LLFLRCDLHLLFLARSEALAVYVLNED
jgi:hypothetical protein